MKILKNVVCIAVIFISVCLSLYSTGQGLNLHAGYTFPKGDFGSDTKKYGGAANGPELGLQYVLDLKLYGLKAFLGADVMYNGLEGKIKAYWDETNIPETHAFINVPVTAGLHYSVGLPNIWFLKMKNKVSVYGEAGIGPDFMKITNEKQKEVTIQYKLSTRLGYKAGGGLSYKDKYFIGIHYYGLGTKDVKYVEPVDGSDGVSDISANLLSLSLGVNFQAFRKK